MKHWERLFERNSPKRNENLGGENLGSESYVVKILGGTYRVKTM